MILLVLEMFRVKLCVRRPPPSSSSSSGSSPSSSSSSSGQSKSSGLGTYRNVFIRPLPLTSTPPVLSHRSRGSSDANVSETWMQPGWQLLSMRDAVFIVSPNSVNLGILEPTRPETRGPVWMPMRRRTGVWL